jgi:predicted dehydrogenase
VIGGGKIATNAHLPAFKSNKYVNLIGIVDTDIKKAQKAGKKFGIKNIFSSVDELFEKVDLDAISICTPPNTHEEITIKAFNNGCHVLCEKPIETDVERAKKMVEFSKKKEKILMIGFNRRFWPNYIRSKKAVLNGNLGHTYSIEYHCMQPNPLLKWGKSRWFYEAGIGGVILDLGPHVFDILNFIFNDYPKSISATSTTHSNSPVEESCVSILEYPENRIGIGSFSWLSSVSTENLNIYGTAQNLFVSPKFYITENPVDISEISIWRETTKYLIGQKFPSLFNLLKINTYHLEINTFIKKILNSEKTSTSALSALNVLITSEAAKKSIETNKKIHITSIRSN